MGLAVRMGRAVGTAAAAVVMEAARVAVERVVAGKAVGWAAAATAAATAEGEEGQMVDTEAGVAA